MIIRKLAAIPLRLLLGVVVIPLYSISVRPAAAQNLTVQEWVYQFVSSCVGGGSSDTASGEVGANGDISLRRLALSGTVKGQVLLTHKEARLLSDGINNAMSSAAADEADKVRQCLAPLRAVLIQIMQSQFQGGFTNFNPIYILSPDEDKIIKVLATTRGYLGKTGELVLDSTIESRTGLGDIRYRAAMRRLQSKGYAFEGVNVTQGPTASLMPSGDDYALRVGFAN